MQNTDGGASCVEKFKPRISRGLYRTSVDVGGRHLSGLLLIRQMADSAARLVFTNEAGFKFFDFEFAASGQFTAHYLIKNLNKEAVKKTLQKDFQLILMQWPQGMLRPVKFKGQQENERYFAHHIHNDFYYYITDENCITLRRMERGSSTRKVTEAFMSPLKNGLPDSIFIHHKNFNFDIRLTRMYDN